VFKVNTDGSGFTNVYSFQSSDGAYPQAGLILSGNILYGTTQSGLYRTTQTVNGTVSGYDPGSVFMVNTDGSGFATLYSLNAASDGANPSGTLTLSGITLYGTAYQGGSIGGGSVFSLYVPPSLTITPSGSNVILTWPTNATGFTLQSTLNLGAAAVWNPILPAPDIVNGQYTVTNRISRPQQFYQLVQ